MTSRYHYLDAARGILMILGIVYHAARVYGDTAWVITDEGSSRGLEALALGLGSFRMPAFFLMSGFFAGLTLSKYGPRAFIVKRVPRVVLPFVAALLTLNVAQLYALQVYQGAHPADLNYFVSADLWSDFTSDRWISHLWFLVCLFYYFVATALAAALLQFQGNAGQAVVARAGAMTGLVNRPVVCLAFLPVVNLIVIALFAAFPDLYRIRPLVNMDNVAEYCPFFAVGLFVFVNARLYALLTSFSRSVVVLTAVAIPYRFFGATSAAPGMQVLVLYGHLLWTWLAIYWVMVFFRAVLDRPTRFVATLADSAYTIYLFHHLTVILVAWWLLDVDISIFVKFPIVVAVTFIVTFAVHQLVIRKVPVLSVLFNGKRPRPT